jgi:pimeloyl-ACP methyl ester carboxylesterase
MLALIQKFIAFSLVGVALTWFVFFQDSHFGLALSGLLLLLFGYAFFLLLELLLVRIVGSQDDTPQPSLKNLASAWVGEICVAPMVFSWRQPFCHNAIADQISQASVQQGLRGVLFVHGYFCNRGFWNPWLARLQGGGHAFIALSLEPVFASIDDYADQIDAAVEQLHRATGLPPLLVCHSMGGLAVRAWLGREPTTQRVHHIVTIGTPHHGTWLARFGVGANVRQMRIASAWQKARDQELTGERRRLFTCWYSNSDNIVFPASGAYIAGANKHLLLGAAHVQMAFLPKVMDVTLGMLD